MFPYFFGILGVLILAGLGIWQVQRLAWKNNLIREISESLGTPPISLVPNEINIGSQYLSVSANGKFLEKELHVLHSLKPYGPGFKVIKPFKLSSNEIILVDLGFVEEKNKAKERIFTDETIKGNIFFPNETDFFTPDPNLDRNIWFARSLDSMANYLGTMPILLVLSNSVDRGVITTPLRANLVNNHLQYAVTWFSMAVTWVFMSFYLIIRVTKRYKQDSGNHAL
mgnify:FL=1|tara:strand:+ start:1543 stop:2220 length:678 start_codon:yes stop_codon:yes gene_type:complete